MRRLITLTWLVLSVSAIASAQVIDAFDPGADATVTAVAALPNGSVVIGGDFTGVGGGTGATPRRRIALVSPNGAVDPTFDPGADGAINALAAQTDGKALVAGAFTQIGGGGTGNSAQPYLARLNADGTVDMTFAPVIDGEVKALVVQPNGKILLGGTFRTVNGQPRTLLARLNADGSLDGGFDPGPPNPQSTWVINALALRSNGQFVIGGLFNYCCPGPAISQIARLNTDLSLDLTLTQPTGLNEITAVAVQPDGAIVFAEVTSFTFNSTLFYRGWLSVITAGGTVEKWYLANERVRSLVARASGRVLVAGGFTTLTPTGTLPLVTRTVDHVIQLLPTGLPDAAFSAGVYGNDVRVVVAQPNGRLLVGGDFYALVRTLEGDDVPIGAARLNIGRFAGAANSVYFNGDAITDVLRYNPTSGRWVTQLGRNDGQFDVGQSGFWSPSWSVTPANLDADSFTDMFLANNTTGQWFRMVADGAGGFTSQSNGVWGTRWQRFVVDLNGDALSDVFLWDSAAGEWFECISATDGAFSYVHGFWSPGWEVTPMKLDVDSPQDFFLFNRASGQWFWAAGTSNGGFSYPQTGAWSPDWQFYPGDYDANGITDMFLWRPGTGMWFVALAGSGFSYTSGFFTTGYSPYVLDLDANGRSDLLLHNATTGQWFQLISTGAGGFTNAGGGAWSGGWSVSIADLNGDGRDDVFLYNTSTGVWYEARNLTLGAFSYTTGAWSPGYTIIASRPYFGG